MSNSVTLELGTALIGWKVDNNIVRAQARDVFRCSGLSRPDAAEAPPILRRGAGDLFPFTTCSPRGCGEVEEEGGGGVDGERRGSVSSWESTNRAYRFRDGRFTFVIQFFSLCALPYTPPPPLPHLSATCRHGTGLRRPSSSLPQLITHSQWKMSITKNCQLTGSFPLVLKC